MFLLCLQWVFTTAKAARVIPTSNAIDYHEISGHLLKHRATPTDPVATLKLYLTRAGGPGAHEPLPPPAL